MQANATMPTYYEIRTLIQRTQRTGKLSKEDRGTIQRMIDGPNGWDFYNRKWLGIGPNDSICAVASEMHRDFRRILDNNNITCTPPEGGWPTR